MKSLLLLFLSASFLLDSGAAFAQANDSAKAKEKNHLIIGATYNSALNYYGRVDSLKSSGICPFIGYELKDGLYLNTTFIFIHNNLQSEYAATVVEAGYNFNNKKNTWAGNLSASAYFYQPDIDLVQSAIKESFNASITHLNPIIDVTLGVSAKVSDELDYVAQGSLDHIVKFTHVFGKGIILLDPSASVYAGTQNFMQTYYQQEKFLILPVGEQAVTSSSRVFNVLAYEGSMPIVFAYKKLNLTVTPSYIMPENIITVPGQPALSEMGSNLFYVTATVKFTL